MTGKPIRIEQVRLIDPKTDRDEITTLTLNSTDPETPSTIDGTGLILGPSLVDLYSQCGEPGFEERETLASLEKAAIAGGFTQVNVLPGNVIDNPAQLLWFQSQNHSVLKPWAAITQGAAGSQLNELGEIAAQKIAVGFADGSAIASLTLLRRLLEYAQPLGMTIALWPMDEKLAEQGLAREGTLALRYGLPGMPAFTETAPLAVILELVREIGTAVHLMRISTGRSVALIQAAKAEGLPITASTTWLHLLYDTQDLSDYHPSLRLNPPLGNPDDRVALISGVKSGMIDAIAIDHSPYTYEEKTVAFGEAPVGAIGLEFAFALLWQALVTTGKLTAVELWRAMATNPDRCLGQCLGECLGECLGQSGGQSYMLFDPNETWRLANLQSLAQNSHLWGREIVGRVRSII
jgi:dihydroorotase